MTNHFVEFKFPFKIENMTMNYFDQFIVLDFKSNIYLINADGSIEKKWLCQFPYNNYSICNLNLVYNNLTNNIYFQIDINNCLTDRKIMKFNLSNEIIKESSIIRSSILSHKHNKFIIDNKNRIIVLDGNTLKIITDSEKILSWKKSSHNTRLNKSFFECDSYTEIKFDVEKNSDLVSDVNGNVFLIRNDNKIITMQNLDGEIVRTIDFSIYDREYIHVAFDYNNRLYFLCPREKNVIALDEHNICVDRYIVDPFSNKIFFNSQNELIVLSGKKINIFSTYI